MGASTHSGPSPAVAFHALPLEEVLAQLEAGRSGLTSAEVAERLRVHGRNTLPRSRPRGVVSLFLGQFASPLIYILLAAAAVSLAIGHLADAGFIVVVLLLNAIIGTVQERAAERSADALRSLITATARVVRDGEDQEVPAEELVPGDLVRLESGLRVPADLRLVSELGLGIDESLLTGESDEVSKDAEAAVSPEAGVGDRPDMAFAGSIVMRGRATGVVVATAATTELGRIASSLASTVPGRAPLLVRMDRFSRRVAVAVMVAVSVLAVVALMRGTAPVDVFLMAVALAVSAIPEGLPVALTVALSIGARRMSGRHVITRRLVAVEALGSCTFIASDKTGTLTMNDLTARAVLLAGDEAWRVSGEGDAPEGEVLVPVGARRGATRLERLCIAAAACNDGYLALRDGSWTRHGDAVDVALLVLARKGRVERAEVETRWPRTAEIPYEPERGYAAVLCRDEGARGRVFVKGALERLLPMCGRMEGPDGPLPLDAEALERDAEALAAAGHRVLALADGEIPAGEVLEQGQLRDLTFLGLVGLRDPLRPHAAEAVKACRRAGIEVAMVTGDHPVTALSVARELGMAGGPAEVVLGRELREAGSEGIDGLVRRARVFARVEPAQKLDIVRSLQRAGHFVAVTGDGANDAPALRAAHIGVAMGRRGTDVARESAALVLADDDFASIVAGIEEGRIAYANVRKVVFLLVSTGAAEIVLFVLAALAGLPLPLTAVQLLWLNLVTNGIQDVALAFEPGEGGELDRPPRPPGEPVLDRLMVRRTLLAAVVMGGGGFLAWAWALGAGWDPARAQSGLLLTMVLFENAQAGNSRSEWRSVLAASPLRNPLLLFGAALALLLHVSAMHAPWLSTLLGAQPAGAEEWAFAVAAALALVGVMEVEKGLRRLAGRGQGARAPAGRP
jgi:magnesium-transporting ATPase (P-type)